MERSKARIIYTIIIISLAVLMNSCSAKWHLKKAIKKDPTLVQLDSIHWKDTIYTHTERVEVDSTFIVSSDTVVIIKDNLTIKHWIHQDSVFIEGQCDTIFQEIPYETYVPYEKVVYVEDKINWTIIFLVIGLFLALVLRKYIVINYDK